MSSVRSQEVLVGNTIFVSLSEVWPVSQCPDTRCGPACGAQLSCSLKMIVNQVGCSTVRGAVQYMVQYSTWCSVVQNVVQR